VGTFIATWNPKKSELSPQDLAAAITDTSAGKVWRGAWSMGARTQGIVPGDRVFLLRQNVDRGLIASGVAASDIYLAEKWDGSGADAPYVDVEWDRVLDPADRLPTELLQGLVPGVPWRFLRASGGEEKEGLGAQEDRETGM